MNGEHTKPREALSEEQSVIKPFGASKPAHPAVYFSDQHGWSGAWAEVAEQLKRHNPNTFFVGLPGTQSALKEIRRRLYT